MTCRIRLMGTRHRETGWSSSWELSESRREKVRGNSWPAASPPPPRHVSPAPAAPRAQREARASFREQQAKLQAELEEAKRTVEEQRARIERLEKERAGLTLERDQYLRSLYALLPRREIRFTEEELRDLEQNGV